MRSFLRVPSDVVLAIAFAAVLREGLCTIVVKTGISHGTGLVCNVAALADCQGEHHHPIRSKHLYLCEVFPSLGSLFTSVISYPGRICSKVFVALFEI